MFKAFAPLSGPAQLTQHGGLAFVSRLSGYIRRGVPHSEVQSVLDRRSNHNMEGRQSLSSLTVDACCEQPLRSWDNLLRIQTPMEQAVS